MMDSPHKREGCGEGDPLWKRAKLIPSDDIEVKERIAEADKKEAGDDHPPQNPKNGDCLSSGFSGVGHITRIEAAAAESKGSRHTMEDALVVLLDAAAMVDPPGKLRSADMPFEGCPSKYSSKALLLYLPTVILLYLPVSAAIVVPDSNCYVVDNSSHILDFTDWIGHTFEHNGEDADFVIRFCKDVESRSQAGYVDFGRYSSFDHPPHSSDPVNFVQKYYGGDLAKCENTFDKMGRNTQVNIICGGCLHGSCKGELGCICDVTYDRSMCRAIVELSIPCKKASSRVFEGFTIGFHPRTWEVVYNGFTQQGFEETNYEYRFETEQTHVSLYLTAISALSGLVGKPTFTVNPSEGLYVKLSGSAAHGYPPTTLSPTILELEWICEIAHSDPYEVAISIPVQGYEPVEFSLSKKCEYAQESEEVSANGWAIFGVTSCVLIVLSSLLCCGGFIYKVNAERQHGLNALPGITLLSTCLEAVSMPHGYGSQVGSENEAFMNQAQGYGSQVGAANEVFMNQTQGYGQPQEADGAFINQVQASWDRQPFPATQEAQRFVGGSYGTMRT